MEILDGGYGRIAPLEPPVVGEVWITLYFVSWRLAFIVPVWIYITRKYNTDLAYGAHAIKRSVCVDVQLNTKQTINK